MYIRRPWLVLAIVAALAAVPTAAIATHYFSDVPDNSPHAAGIEFVADWGITSGCTADEYCPAAPVTRQQMATFLFRSSGHSPSVGPVANALLIDDTYFYDGFELLGLDGGSPHECVAAEPLNADLGPAIVTHDLVSSPDGVMSPANINVAVDYDEEPGADEYAVCFQTLDGSNLPGGEYETVFSFSLYLGDFAVGASDGTSVPDLAAVQSALETKSAARR